VIEGFVEKYRSRFLTAIVLIGAVAFVLFFNNKFIMWAVLGLVFMLSFHESLKLFNIKNDMLYVLATLLWVLALFLDKPHEIVLLIVLAFVSYLAYTKNVNQKLLYPFLYPSFSILLIYSLYLDYGVFSLFWLIVVVALTDIFAFFSGKKFGKTSFSISSPNKTLEGVIGGVVVGSLIGFLISIYHFGIFKAMLISVVVSIFSVFGDLFESYLKREAGVKDSGNILPGHGGMLDRVDGYLFGVVGMYVLLNILK